MIKRILFFLGVFVLMSGSCFAIMASGDWNFGIQMGGQTGEISFTFPPEGGELEIGSFWGEGGGQSKLDMDGIFMGEFTGGWNGKFSGTFHGSASYEWPDPKSGQIVRSSVAMEGNWTGYLSESEKGVMRVHLVPFTGAASDMTAKYDVTKFETELRLAEIDEDAMVESGVVPDGVAKVTAASMGYVIVDGKKYSLGDIGDRIGKDGFMLQPGMTVGVDHMNGELELELGEGSSIYLQGEGTEIEVLSRSDIDPDKWAKIVGNLPAGNVIAMGPGQMVVRYKTGEKEGYWVPDTKNLAEEGGELNEGWYGSEQRVEGTDDTASNFKYIVFSTDINAGMDLSDFSEAIGTIGGLRDTGHRAAPLPQEYYMEDAEPSGLEAIKNFFFGVHSEVEFNYDGETTELKVYEGRVDVFKTDFKGNVELIASVPEGESLKMNFNDYGAGEELVNEDFDVTEESEIMEKARGGSSGVILYAGVGVGVLMVVIIVVALVRRRKIN
ncbi:MAG: hypothetical protein V1679_02660 [Candidatus Peregrinibacteria bacterium]